MSAILHNSDYDNVLTVTETGKKYIVKAQFPSGTVRCWGELTAFKNNGRQRTFENKDKTFTAQTEFTIERVVADLDLANELFEQCCATKTERGDLFRVSSWSR